jgi:oxalate decarboxylase
LFGDLDEPRRGAINMKGNPSSVTDPGPDNPGLANEFPGAFSPPATDVAVRKFRLHLSYLHS